jgi:hypothetical protein
MLLALLFFFNQVKDDFIALHDQDLMIFRDFVWRLKNRISDWGIKRFSEIK